MSTVVHVNFVLKEKLAESEVVMRRPRIQEPRRKTIRDRVGRLQYFPKLGIWKDYSGNCTFDPKNNSSYSYRWWQVTKDFDGVMVFNSYRYSVTTAKHQSSIRQMLEHVGVREYIEIQAPHGLQNLRSAHAHYSAKIEELENQIKRKGSRKAKNAERRELIKTYLAKLDLINTLDANTA